METVSLDEAEPDAPAEGVERHRLTELLGSTDVAVNRYRVAPGEGLPGGLHAHCDQEEVFVVLAGTATFETLAQAGMGESPEGADAPGGGDSSGGDVGPGDAGGNGDAPPGGGTVTVSAGEAVRFAPGEFQTGRNDGDDDLVVLALGAPRDTEDVRIPVTCPECGHGNVRFEAGPEGVAFVCPDCGATRVPEPCPECGGDDLRVRPGDQRRTVVVCRDCGHRTDEPPVAG